MQGIFETINQFQAHSNWRPNFDKSLKNKIFKLYIDFDNYKDRANKLVSYMHKILQTNV